MPDILTSIPPRQTAVSRLILACALVCTAAAAWLSQGTIAFTGEGDARIALLPLSARRVVDRRARAGGRLCGLAPRRVARSAVAPRAAGSAVAAAVAAGCVLHLVGSAGAGSCGRRSRSRSRRRCGCPLPAIRRAPLTAGILACAIVCGRRVAGRAVGPGRRRAALPDHHAEPAEGWRSADREQPPARRLPRVLSRAICPGRTSAAAGATARSTRFTPRDCRRSSPRRLRSAGYRGVLVFLILLAAAGSALAWHLAWVVTRRADAAWFGWAAVTLVHEQHLSQLHRLPGRARRRDRADRRLGAPARGDRKPRAGDGANRSLVAARRGAGAAAVAAHAVCAASRAALARWCCSACHDTQRRRQGGRVPAVPAVERDRRGSGSSSPSTGRPIPLVPYAHEAGSVGVHSRRTRRVVLRSAVRPARLRAGARAARLPGSAVMVRRSRDAPPRARAAVRPRPVSSGRHALRDVVGRQERSGAVLRADALHAGDPGRRRVGGDARTAPRAPRRSASLLVTAFASCALVFVGGGRLAFNDRETLRRLAGMAQRRRRSRTWAARLVARQRSARCSATSRSGLCAIAAAWGVLRAAQGDALAARRAARSAPQPPARMPSRRCARSRSSGRSRAPAP